MQHLSCICPTRRWCFFRFLFSDDHTTIRLQVKVRNGLPFNVVIPTRETLATFETTDADKDLVVCKDVDEMFNKPGI
jgi:hypothetical protein